MAFRRRRSVPPLLRRSVLTIAAGLAVALTACGPSTPLKAGLAPVDLNVRLGNYATPPAPQPPQPPAFANLVAGFPQPFIPQVSFAPEPTYAPVACPTAPPFAFPPLAAGDGVGGPPVANKVYPFRYTGSYQSGGKVTPYQTTGSRTVTGVKANPVGSDGGFDFSTVESWNGYTTTTSFHVIRNGASPQNVPVTNQAPASGIYLTQQVITGSAPGASPQVFAPKPMILVMSFPAQPGAPVGGHGVDATTGASETVQPSGQGTISQGYTQLQSPGAATPTPAVTLSPIAEPQSPVPGSSILGDDRVNACGTVLDAWQVELVGSYTSPQLGTYNFDDTYDFATEYGGIPIAEHHHGTGTRTDGSTFTFDVLATIDVAPPTS